MSRARTRVTRTLAVATVAAAMLMTQGPPAGAGGGDWVYPARDRYEAGQTVTMIGYGSGVDEALRAEGPFYAWLRADPAAVEADDLVVPRPWPSVHPTDLRMAAVLVEDVGPPAEPEPFVRDQRLSVTFDLPPGLPDRAYEVFFCNDPCTYALGNFVAEALHVGVDPGYPIVRDWRLEDPAIRWLGHDALLQLPSGEPITAAQVRAGAVPESAAPAPPAPTAASPAPAADPAPAAPASEPRPRSTAAGTAAEASADDGGAAAWWVVGEVAVLVGGAAAALAWSGRRRRGASARISVSSVPPAPIARTPPPDPPAPRDPDGLVRTGPGGAPTVRS